MAVEQRAGDELGVHHVKSRKLEIRMCETGDIFSRRIAADRQYHRGAVAGHALQDKIDAGIKIEHELLLGNELPVITGLHMDDRGAEDAVERDDAGEVSATQPPGITHPSLTVVAV